MLRSLRLPIALLLIGGIVAATATVADSANRVMRGRNAVRLGACAGCAPLAPVEPPSLVGTYDVQISGSDERFVGEIRDDAGRVRLSIALDLLSSIHLDVTAGTRGELLLDGHLLAGGDFFMPREGEAYPARTSRGTRIDAIVRDSTGRATGFVLTRPSTGVPRRFEGSYEIALCDGRCADGRILGTSTLDLAVGRDGRGTVGVGTLSSPDGDPLGEIGELQCRVSPGGSIECRGPYEPATPSVPGQSFPESLRLVGRIGRVAGAGEFLLGVILPPLVRVEIGGWIATPVGRVEER